jgi:hypothetical protein
MKNDDKNNNSENIFLQHDESNNQSAFVMMIFKTNETKFKGKRCLSIIF